MSEYSRAKPRAEIVELILVRSSYGEGTEKDICRELVQYFEKDGRLVAEIDPKRTIEQVEQLELKALRKMEKAIECRAESERKAERLRAALKDILNEFPIDQGLTKEKRDVLQRATAILATDIIEETR